MIRVSDRDGLQSDLKGHGIGTEVYYPVPMHRQECFEYLNLPEGAFPESEKAAKHTLALPIQPELTEEQAQYVVTCIGDFMTRTASQPVPVRQSAAGLNQRP